MTEQPTDDRACGAGGIGLSTGSRVDVERMTDEELLLEYRLTGNSALFETLVKRYERELYNYLRRFLSNQVLAEDAFQATFMQVHLKCHLFDKERKVRPWLYTVATNQAIDIQRRNRRHKLVSLDRPNRLQHDELGSLMDVLSSREDEPTDGLEQVERKEWVRLAVAVLLVVAVGSNYSLFMDWLRHQPAADEDTLASLLLANLTIVLSFGLIALSQIPALSAIGRVVAPGALLALLLSAAYASSSASPSARMRV